MDCEENRPDILSLPDEVLTIILYENSTADIVRFGLTCKRLYNYVTNSNYLWKKKVKAMLPEEILTYMEVDEGTNWMDIYKQYYVMRRSVYCELTKLITSHYSRAEEIQLPEVKDFFDIVVGDSGNYYYVVYLLQDLISKANRNAEEFHCIAPFTLSEAHYAKDVLCYLMQLFLIVRWVQGDFTETIPPEYVLNFFIQWMDPYAMHPDEKVKNVIDDIVEMVEKVLLPKEEAVVQFEEMANNMKEPLGPDQLRCRRMSVPEKLAKRLLDDMDVLEAISNVIYRQMRLEVVESANLDTLDILTVVKNKCGDAVAIASLYHAVASRLGVRCELVTIRDHLFMQWNHPRHGESRLNVSKLDLRSGEWMPRVRCPFTANNFHHDKYKFSARSVLKYVAKLFLNAKGYVRDWYYKNDTILLGFVDNTRVSSNPYRNFLPHLLDHGNIPSLKYAVKLTSMHRSHLALINSLMNLNAYPEPVYKHMTVKKRGVVDVKYPVGLICTHNKYDYLCVVVGWETRADRNCNTATLRHRGDQPFYHVVALDLSNRYIAQENLDEMKEPYRLYHLEEVIAKEFTHFDGFSYVPNRAKRREYPNDDPIRLAFRSKAGMPAGPEDYY